MTRAVFDRYTAAKICYQLSFARLGSPELGICFYLSGYGMHTQRTNLHDIVQDRSSFPPLVHRHL